MHALSTLILGPSYKEMDLYMLCIAPGALRNTQSQFLPLIHSSLQQAADFPHAWVY